MAFRRLPREWGFTLVANALISVEAAAQTALPDITIRPKKTAPAKLRVPHASSVARPHPGGLVHAAPAQGPHPPPIVQAAPTPPPAAPPTLDHKMKELDAARDALLPKTGASVFTFGREAIENLPQGDNTPIDKVLLQAPGVAADSAIGGPSGFHVRNEYANVQYRINGVVLPEGVGGLGPLLDTSFVTRLSLLTSALPAQYKTQFTMSMICGSGLRSGFANMDHVPAYFVVNLGTERELELVPGAKPLTARFDVTNVSDRKYELRSGTGIGVFAPQYGARRGFFVGLSQKL